MEKPLYELIRDSAVDGRLPAGFSLPKQKTDKVAFADGALDGIMMYHRAPGHQLSEEQTQLISAALKMISDGSFYEAEELVWRIVEEIGAFDAHGPLRNTVAMNHERLDLNNLAEFASIMINRSPYVGVVKAALSIMSLFRPPEEEKEVIRTLGLSDEFALYAAEAMESWEDTNDEWFRLARKVDGWGRIHLVRMLRPETEEIRRWLLTEGIRNTVMPEYSALECWEKADVPAYLAGVLTREEFCCVRDIIEALLNDIEGPVVGISGVENAEMHLLAFLGKAKETEPDEQDRAVISRIRDRFKENKEITDACDAALRKELPKGSGEQPQKRGFFDFLRGK